MLWVRKGQAALRFLSLLLLLPLLLLHSVIVFEGDDTIPKVYLYLYFSYNTVFLHILTKHI